MKRFTNGVDWPNRYGEAKDLGFDGVRLNVPEIHALFPNKPVFLPAQTRRYLYEVDWAATASGTNRFAATTWGQGGQTFKTALLAAKSNGMDIIVHFNFNGFGGTWSTPNLAFTYQTQTVTLSSGSGGGTTSLAVNSLARPVPAGSVLTFVRGGSGYQFTAYVSAAASGGATSVTTYFLAGSPQANDVVAVIRAGSYIGSLTVSTSSAQTDSTGIVQFAVNATGFALQVNDQLLFYRGGTIITTTTTSARAAAGATSLSVSALGSAVQSGDFAHSTDCPTASEPYGYRHPNPADAQANTDAALAMVAYILNDPDILYPPEKVILEEWNEPDQRVFGGMGVPGVESATYAPGWGFFSHPVKHLQSVRVPQVRDAFPNIPFISSSFSFGGGTPANSVREENFVVSGLVVPDEDPSSYWEEFTALNKHSYVAAGNGSKLAYATNLYNDLNDAMTRAAAFGSLGNKKWHMTETGVRPNMLTATLLPDNSRLIGEYLLVNHDVCAAMGMESWGLYCYHYRSTTNQLTVAVAGASQGATSIPLTAATGVAIPAGAVLYFGSQGAKATLTAAAASNATSLTVAALPTAVASGDKSWYVSRSDNEFLALIPDMVSRNSLFIGVGEPKGKFDSFWVLAERFARVPLPAAPEPLPDL